jgi:mono/diheme cytochrome c family protein
MAMLQPNIRASSAMALFVTGILGATVCVRGQAPAATPASDWATFQKTVQPFFAKHCFACHDAKASGEVRLDQFRDEAALVKGQATVEKALGMLRQRAMPPKKRPQPSAEEVKPVLAWLEAFRERMDREAPADAGRVMVRRLNRTEYNNTVRDLLGVHFKPGDEFPADVPGHGFDNIAGALTVSPVLVEKYLAAAEKVARTAVFGPEPMKPERTPHQPFFTADAFSKNKTPKHVYDETGMSLPSALHVVQRFPADGEYDFRAIMRGVRPAGSKPIELGFWIDGKLVHETKLAVPTKLVEGRQPGEINGLWAEFRAPMTAGEHWLSVTLLRMFEGLPAAYKGPKPAAEAKGAATKAVDAFFPMYLDVVGPHKQVLGPRRESIAKILPATPGPYDAAAVRKIVSDLVRRAYRRPATASEIDRLAGLVAMVQKDGDSFEEGLCVAIQQMLVSPHFLFRIEKTPPPGPGPRRIGQHELATRLSYFLWSSMPDDELLRCADEGTLFDGPALEAQVRRMLKDSKASALVENFGGQWLQTRALESHTPDRVKYVEFTEYTRMSLKKETDLFFEHILREDRSILDFIDANYTFLNERLADFYKVPGVKGHAFRKVDLTGTRRGGVLTHGSVLTVSSYANRTSPVLRGKWILENFLNAPPPAPPADVPSFDEEGVGKTISLREQFEKHRSNAACASCHARMDPLGFALENFDAIGAWREKDGKFPIETAGSLPDGRSFKGHEDLRAILKADAAAFAECLADKMLTYALGRGLERADKSTVRAVAEKTARGDYRFSSLVLAIVQSPPFQMHNESRERR